MKTYLCCLGHSALICFISFSIIQLCFLFLFLFMPSENCLYTDGDEMEILASIEAESSLEELDHQLLTTPPNSEMTPPRVMNSAKDN